ncbi:MAG: NAD-dependent epimerase [Alphaproteobacteria bacterium]|nr:MAG: NAD-dependent epimerase [Alphaproteobacteria bacterium]
MTTLITGAAGFIGFHTARALLARGEPVIGLDNLNDYYSPALKRARLERLATERGFTFVEADIAEMDQLTAAVAGRRIVRIVHLAAQAGVRHSLDNPHAYVRSNLVGHANMLELARYADALEHMCYASSSSVYGGRTDLPFRETDRVDAPVSLYAATKRADELMSHTYSHLYRIPQTGLRFFTVYGPWGRPDMAYWTFTEKILAGEQIQVFNRGDMLRDFTYVDDIVEGVVRIVTTGHVRPLEVPHALYNIGNNRPERLNDFIAILERLTGRRAVRQELPMQPGDVPATYADITAIRADYGFEPTTDLDTGLARFVAWFRQHFNV